MTFAHIAHMTFAHIAHMTVAHMDVCPYEVPPHIPEHHPFRMQTKHFHVIHHPHILSKSSYSSPYISPLPTPHFYKPTDTKSSTLLRFGCPNHLKSATPHHIRHTVQIHKLYTVQIVHCTNPHCFLSLQYVYVKLEIMGWMKIPLYPRWVPYNLILDL